MTVMATDPNAGKSWTSDQLAFQVWLALPSAARDPKQQRQLAKVLGVSEFTLSDWKRLPGWHDAVYDLAMAHVVGDLVPVLHAQVREAKKGSLPHAQWLFEVAGKWTPKQKLQHGNDPDAPINIGIRVVDYREGIAALKPPEADADE